VIAVGTTREVIKIEHPFIKQFFLGERGKRALAIYDQRQDQRQDPRQDQRQDQGPGPGKNQIGE
jgi:phospholipid/cholesterol/gamma-HCH transport system ATP-binding protein